MDDPWNFLGGSVPYLIGVIVVFVLGMMVSSLLIHGARKEKQGFLMPWMVLTGIYLIMYIACLFFCRGWPNIITSIILLFHLYSLVVVSSLRKQLKNKEKSPPPNSSI